MTTSYIKTTLLPEEKILYYSRPHFIVFAQTIMVFLLALMLILIGPIYRTIGVLALVAAVIQAMMAYIYFIFSEYAITNKRVIMKVGFISRRSLEIFSNRVEGIYVNQSIMGRIFDYGSVTICGIGGSRDTFNYIPDPISFRNQSLQETEKAAQNVRIVQ